MMRLPAIRIYRPTSIAEAAAVLAGEGGKAAVLAGGTDLVPNMKRGQATPQSLIALRRIQALQHIENGSGLTLGAGLTLNRLLDSKQVREYYPALWQAAKSVGTPQLRNMGTLGGNLCIDTRCSFYNRSEGWRKAIDYCLKRDGETCWAVTRSETCRAVSSTDTAPALMALGARLRLVSENEQRLIPLADFYGKDGIEFLARRPDEIVTEILLEPGTDWRSTYWKLRRRGTFDFPLMSVAASVRLRGDDTVAEARVILGAVDARPVVCSEVAELLAGQKLTDEVIEEVGRLAMSHARPVNNTDLEPLWRKKMVPVFLAHALRELRGDDVHELRARTAQATAELSGGPGQRIRP